MKREITICDRCGKTESGGGWSDLTWETWVDNKQTDQLEKESDVFHLCKKCGKSFIDDFLKFRKEKGINYLM